jgi:hypothetical protein
MTTPLFTASKKPLGRRNYGSIAHLPGSRLGPGDHKCHEGQEKICTEKARDKHDLIIVQEKLDGSNVGVARVNGQILALSRAGYLASTSPYEQHHHFSFFVEANTQRFLDLLEDGERVVGEWLLVAHGTRYLLQHEPFVAFDIMREAKRAPWSEVAERTKGKFVTPFVAHIGGALSIPEAMERLGEFGRHGALDPIEGAMWRVERKGAVDFLAKYVKPGKVDGAYLESVTGLPAVWNRAAGDGGTP